MHVDDRYVQHLSEPIVLQPQSFSFIFTLLFSEWVFLCMLTGAGTILGSLFAHPKSANCERG